jgi:ribosomal protein S18 acetylase RimI-like enzyme
MDAAVLATFAARTFRETFSHSTSAEHMAEHLATSYGVAQQTRELESPDCITFLMEHRGALVAFTQVRRGTPPECVTAEDAVELQRFYVDSPWHGRGLAQELMRAARDAGRELGGRHLWLSVWEHNARGIAFYRKAGFHDAGSAHFWVGSDRQADRIMIAPVG